MHLVAGIEWTERSPWRPWLSECVDAQRARDRVNWEMHLEAMIERVWRPCRCGNLEAVMGGDWCCSWRPKIEWTERCTSRPWWTDVGDAQSARDCVHWPMQSDAVMERVGKPFMVQTWKPWSMAFIDSLGGRILSELGDAVGSQVWTSLGATDRANLEAVIWRVPRCTGRPWTIEYGRWREVGRSGGGR